MAAHKADAPRPALPFDPYAADPVERELAFKSTYGPFLRKVRG